MIISYYQRILLSSEELKWEAACGPGLWVEAYRHPENGSLQDSLIAAFLTGNAQMQSICGDTRGLSVVAWFVKMFVEVPMSRICELVKNAEYVLPESVENAPQLSSYASSTDGIIDLLSQSERELDFEEIGYHLNPNGRGASKVANIKFGENCAKFAALLGLVEIPKRKCVQLTTLGAVALSTEQRRLLYPRLFLRLPLFRDLVCASDAGMKDRFCKTLGEMSEATKARRASAFNIMRKEFVAAGGTFSDEAAARDLIWKMRH